MTTNVFYKKYQGRMLKDDGRCNSQDFIQFARDLRSTIRSIAKEMDASVCKCTIGHYYVSGFIVKEDHYLYFSFDYPRHMLLNLQRDDASQGILIRTAKDSKDFTGGMNHFCNIFTMKDTAEKLIKTLL